MSDIKIDGERFYSHAKHIYELLGDSSDDTSSCFQNIDALILIRGKHVEDIKECIQVKTSRFHEYILGYDFSESIITISPKKMTFFVASKKKMYLNNMERPNGISFPEINVVLRSPAEDNTDKIQGMLKDVVKDVNKQKIKLGYIKEEKGIGKTVEEFAEAYLKYKDNIELVDIPLFVDEILQCKDKYELNLINISSKYSCFLLDYMNKEFEDIIQNDKTVTHEKISNDIKKLAEKESFLKKFSEKNSRYKVDTSLIEIKTNPIIQSGGNYTWDSFYSSDEKSLSSDVIICKTSAAYKEYKSQIIRTFMIEADKEQQLKYKILLSAFEKIINLLKEYSKNNSNKTIGDIYKEVKEFIISKDEKLGDFIPPCMGYGIGLEASSDRLRITEDCKIPPQKGMVFFIIVSIEIVGKNKKKYMLQIGDTVAITDNGEVTVYTEKTLKGLNDIHYDMKDDNEGESEDDKSDKESKIKDIDNGSNIRVTRHMGKKIDEKLISAEKRKQHQEKLLKEKNDEFIKKYHDGASDLKEEAEIKKQDFSKIKCFDNIKQFPSELKQGRIFLSPKNFTIFLPLFKQMVPFHIALIKNASKSEDSNYSNLRINFVIPVSGIDLGIIKGDNPVFIKEVSYKYKDSALVQKIITQIKEMTREYKAKVQENKEKDNLFKEEHLIIRKEKKIVLKEVIIRPLLSTKKTSGDLEVHTNGFRFLTKRGEKVDIIFSNIKHAFLQTCETELIALVHFHLKNPILIGKKKTTEVQFYKEACSQAEDLGMGNRGNDYIEYENELKERQNIEKMNKEFIRFVKNIEDLGEMKIKFDLPYRELEFTGVPYRSNVTLFPTQNCLVSLVEIPAFVITLSEINIVYFERVSQNLKNFDMAFIFKDLSKPIQRITTIPMETLDMLKSWLDENDILFGEGLYNMSWPLIIQKIKSDPKGFIEEGCWNFLAENASEDASEDEDNDQDSEYQEEEQESSESEYLDEDESYEDSESKGEDEGESALSEEGKSWESLAKDAIKSDKEQAKKIKEEGQAKKKQKHKK